MSTQLHSYNLSRFLCYKSMENLAFRYNIQNSASISGSENLCRIAGIKEDSIHSFNYPEYNILELDIESNKYDSCICDQVIEHVQGDPFVAISECARILKPGGYLIITSVTTYPAHFGPKDLWRFTPDGLNTLLESAQLSVEMEGFWGGKSAWIILLLKLNRIRVRSNSFPLIRHFACKANPKWPAVVWAVGKKKQ